jgi:hypothetical protein
VSKSLCSAQDRSRCLKHVQDAASPPLTLTLHSPSHSFSHFSFYSLAAVYEWLRLAPFIFSFIHSVICLTTGPKPLPKRFLHIVRSRASSFKWEYPHLSLRSSSSFLRLRPRLLVTSISPFIFPSITCFRRQFRTHYMFRPESVIHSFSILSDDRSKTSSKTIPPHSAI